MKGYKLHIYTGADCILSTSFMEFDHWSFEGAKKLHGMRQKELHQNRFGIGMSIFVFSLPWVSFSDGGRAMSIEWGIYQSQRERELLEWGKKKKKNFDF